MSADTKVAAVVVTYRRPDVLASTLAGIATQTAPAWHLVVVDNDGDHDDVRRIVESAGVPATYVPAAGNLGYGAGLAIGIEHLRGDEHDEQPTHLWLLDDDSPPAATSLERSLSVLRSDPSIGLVSTRGGRLRRGRLRHDLHDVAAGTIVDADFALVDGCVVTSAAVDAIGLPRRDLFMMMEDVDYTTRVAEAGFRVVVRARDESRHLHLGSSGPTPWRGYYQSRNLLRIAIERRSTRLGVAWALRELGFVVTLARRRRWAELHLRLAGTLDAIRNRMGRTLEPNALRRP